MSWGVKSGSYREGQTGWPGPGDPHSPFLGRPCGPLGSGPPRGQAQQWGLSSFLPQQLMAFSFPWLLLARLLGSCSLLPPRHSQQKAKLSLGPQLPPPGFPPSEVWGWWGTALFVKTPCTGPARPHLL